MPAIAFPPQQSETEMLPPLHGDDESGYASGSSSEASILDVFFTKPHLRFLNRQLQNLEPQGMLLGLPSTNFYNTDIDLL